MEPNKYQREEMGKAIRAAAKHDIVLVPADFRIVEGEVFLDGMDPMEWVEAMVMD